MIKTALFWGALVVSLFGVTVSLLCGLWQTEPFARIMVVGMLSIGLLGWVVIRREKR